jgi:hypothetical protein
VKRNEVRKLDAKVDDLAIKLASRAEIYDDPQLKQLSESFAGLCTESNPTGSGANQLSIKTLIKGVEALREKTNQYDAVEKATHAKQAIIRSLHFPNRTHRHRAIPENHKKTLTGYTPFLHSGGGWRMRAAYFGYMVNLVPASRPS